MRSGLVEVMVVYAHTVRVGDVVHIAGTDTRVGNMFALPDQRKRLILDNGCALTLGPTTPLIAKRCCPVRVVT
ncbi:hypothetical protein RKE29_09745 [Streptomyces sp. B1866]|uniref:hypothetical protein n=1 Tax=Streptomyces sp. B1866 TaxID=3075431 RepID=UPI002891AAA3|nr:hypothetical protein [Streptomyces sp. B1866]MDT3396924.1 hypothetical protein [Streptomyces sp. B1866]